MKITELIAAVIVAILLGGCAANNSMSVTENSNMFDATYLKAHLIKGKTTESDVRQMFGEPSSKQGDPSSGTETWRYSNDAANDTKHSLIHGLTSMLPGGVAYSEAENFNHGTQKSLNLTFTGGVLKSYYGSLN